MRKFKELKADPTEIGNIAKPPFARLPDPQSLFEARSTRFHDLAAGHDLSPYLELLAELSALQASAQTGLPEPEMPGGDILERAATHKMPPLDRSSFRPDAVFEELFSRFTSAALLLHMPAEASGALQRVLEATPDGRDHLIRNVLAEAIPFEAIAEHTFVAAALQVHFARLAARLDVKSILAVGDGVCPVCGGAPAASVIVGWLGAAGARFCSCSLCGTLWNYVRAKCTLCGSTREVSFQALETSPDTVKAETCGACRGYVKVLYQDKDAALEPIADDVASLGLDLLLREQGFVRGAFNKFLIGY